MENYYLVFKKEEEYLALQFNYYRDNTYDFHKYTMVRNLNRQDYILIDELLALNVMEAIKFAKQKNENELNRIKNENEKLKREKNEILVMNEDIKLAKRKQEYELNQLRSENKELKEKVRKVSHHSLGKGSIEDFIIREVSPYEILGMQKGDNPKEIKNRYRKLLSTFHTDNNGGGSAFMFRIVKSAFEKIERN